MRGSKYYDTKGLREGGGGSGGASNSRIYVLESNMKDLINRMNVIETQIGQLLGMINSQMDQIKSKMTGKHNLYIPSDADTNTYGYTVDQSNYVFAYPNVVKSESTMIQTYTEPRPIYLSPKIRYSNRQKGDPCPVVNTNFYIADYEAKGPNEIKDIDGNYTLPETSTFTNPETSPTQWHIVKNEVTQRDYTIGRTDNPTLGNKPIKGDEMDIINGSVTLTNYPYISYAEDDTDGSKYCRHNQTITNSNMNIIKGVQKQVDEVNPNITHEKTSYISSEVRSERPLHNNELPSKENPHNTSWLEKYRNDFDKNWKPIDPIVPDDPDANVPLETYEETIIEVKDKTRDFEHVSGDPSTIKADTITTQTTWIKPNSVLINNTFVDVIGLTTTSNQTEMTNDKLAFQRVIGDEIINDSVISVEDISGVKYLKVDNNLTTNGEIRAKSTTSDSMTTINNGIIESTDGSNNVQLYGDVLLFDIDRSTTPETRRGKITIDKYEGNDYVRIDDRLVMNNGSNYLSLDGNNVRVINDKTNEITINDDSIKYSKYDDSTYNTIFTIKNEVLNTKNYISLEPNILTTGDIVSRITNGDNTTITNKTITSTDKVNNSSTVIEGSNVAITTSTTNKTTINGKTITSTDGTTTTAINGSNIAITTNATDKTAINGGTIESTNGTTTTTINGDVIKFDATTETQKGKIHIINTKAIDEETAKDWVCVDDRLKVGCSTAAGSTTTTIDGGNIISTNGTTNKTNISGGNITSTNGTTTATINGSNVNVITAETNKTNISGGNITSTNGTTTATINGDVIKFDATASTQKGKIHIINTKAIDETTAKDWVCVDDRLKINCSTAAGSTTTTIDGGNIISNGTLNMKGGEDTSTTPPTYETKITTEGNIVSHNLKDDNEERLTKNENEVKEIYEQMNNLTWKIDAQNAPTQNFDTSRNWNDCVKVNDSLITVSRAKLSNTVASGTVNGLSEVDKIGWADLRGVAYGDGKTVIVGHEMERALVYNGSTWSESGPYVSGNYRGVVNMNLIEYFDNKFVAVDDSGNYYTMNNNNVWSGGNAILSYVSNWNNIKIVIGSEQVDNDESEPVVVDKPELVVINSTGYATYNGSTWSSGTLPSGFSGSLVDIVKNGDMTYYLTANGNVYDGSKLLKSLTNEETFSALDYQNDRLYAISNKNVYYSSNFRDWFNMGMTPMNTNKVKTYPNQIIRLANNNEIYINSWQLPECDESIYGDGVSGEWDLFDSNDGYMILMESNANTYYVKNNDVWTKHTITTTEGVEWLSVAIMKKDNDFLAVAVSSNHVAWMTKDGGTCQNNDNGFDMVKSNGNGKFMFISSTSNKWCEDLQDYDRKVPNPKLFINGETVIAIGDNAEYNKYLKLIIDENNVPSLVSQDVDNDVFVNSNVCCSGDGYFISVASNCDFSYSEDGITWNKSKISEDIGNGIWKFIYYLGGDTFCVFTNDLKYLGVITKGDTWSAESSTLDVIPSIDGIEVLEMVYDGTFFVGVGEITIDGQTISCPFDFKLIGDQINSFNYHETASRAGYLWNNIRPGFHSLLTPTNGIDETQQQMTGLGTHENAGTVWDIYDAPNGFLKSVCYGQIIKPDDLNNPVNGFVAVGTNKAAYSTDGVAWTTSPTALTDCSFSSVCYGKIKLNASDDPIDGFVAVGDGVAAYSTNGTSWTESPTTDLTDCSFSSVCYGKIKLNDSNDPVDGFVAVGDGVAAYSTDGIVWEIDTSTLSEYSFSSVCYGNNTFVAVGTNIAAYSTNGTTWTTSTTTLTNHSLSSVCYGNNKFIATEPNNNKVAQSIEKISWTVNEQTGMKNRNWQAFNVVNNRPLALSTNSTQPEHYLAKFSEGIWTETNVTSSLNVENMLYTDILYTTINDVGTYLFIGYENNTIAAYSDGVEPNWTIYQHDVPNAGSLPIQPVQLHLSNERNVVIGYDTSSNFLQVAVFSSTQWTILNFSTNTFSVNSSTLYAGVINDINNFNIMLLNPDDTNSILLTSGKSTESNPITPNATTWEGLCYINNRFVAVSENSLAFTAGISSDSITWKEINNRNLNYHDVKFVVPMSNDNLTILGKADEYYNIVISQIISNPKTETRLTPNQTTNTIDTPTDYTDACVNSSLQYLATCSNGLIKLNTNGKNWEVRKPLYCDSSFDKCIGGSNYTILAGRIRSPLSGSSTSWPIIAYTIDMTNWKFSKLPAISDGCEFTAGVSSGKTFFAVKQLNNLLYSENLTQFDLTGNVISNNANSGDSNTNNSSATNSNTSVTAIDETHYINAIAVKDNGVDAYVTECQDSFYQLFDSLSSTWIRVTNTAFSTKTTIIGVQTGLNMIMALGQDTDANNNITTQKIYKKNSVSDQYVVATNTYSGNLITFNNNRFVVISNSGTMSYFTADGVKWQSSKLPDGSFGTWKTLLSVNDSFIILNTLLSNVATGYFPQQTYDALKKSILSAAYPIGSIYMTLNANITDPADVLDIGQWQRIQNTFLWAVGENNYSYSSGETTITIPKNEVNFQGGEPSHQLTEKELAEHNHECENSSVFYWDTQCNHKGQVSTDGHSTPFDSQGGYKRESELHNHTINNTGGSLAHNNMPPYLSVKMWIRVA